VSVCPYFINLTILYIFYIKLTYLCKIDVETICNYLELNRLQPCFGLHGIWESRFRPFGLHVRLEAELEQGHNHRKPKTGNLWNVISFYNSVVLVYFELKKLCNKFNFLTKLLRINIIQYNTDRSKTYRGKMVFLYIIKLKLKLLIFYWQRL